MMHQGPGVVGPAGGISGVRSLERVARVRLAEKELLLITVATAIWGPGWKGSIVMCHCDNEAVVASIKGGYCRDLRISA